MVISDFRGWVDDRLIFGKWVMVYKLFYLGAFRLFFFCVRVFGFNYNE